VIEAMAFFRFVGAMNAVTVNRTGLEIGNVAVKDFVGIFGKIDPLALDFAFVIEQAKFDAGRIRRKEREVDTLSVPPGAAWKWVALSNVGFSAFLINCGLAAIAPIVQ
jgi:hypothetical protein